ncbi:MAG: group 1 truncated hemoglobin [Myxococcales bacterium]|nr:group 1 truncated hemoglobin [Myxococcales bacterium]MCB9523318.1 group 1 truncated hemoglobin [Myxococcales bacterium]
MSEPTLFAQLGGEPALRTILEDFYGRVYRDAMIGYFFTPHDQARLVQRELEFTAQVLGARDIPYTGQGMRAVHAKHPIRRGHFHRRNRILEQTLRAHAVPEPVFQAWMAHARQLEVAILGAPGVRATHCDHPLQADGEVTPQDP